MAEKYAPAPSCARSEEGGLFSTHIQTTSHSCYEFYLLSVRLQPEADLEADHIPVTSLGVMTSSTIQLGQHRYV